MLVATAVVATLWLAASNQLILYIHPRYVVFTVIMAVIALGVIVASVIAKPAHEHDDPDSPRQKVVSIAALATSLVLGIGLVAVPPAVLTSSTVAQRDINSAGVGADVTSVDDAAAGPDSASADFTVLDWASLLRQTSDLAFYDAKPVDIVGFVTEDPDDPQNVFYVSRFVITCCAVDAQPVGVPVYAPDWRETYSPDDWVEVTGTFGANPSNKSTQPIAVQPGDAGISAIDEPGDPYLF